MKVFEFFSWVVLVVGLKIFRLCLWNRLIMFVISGVLGLMMVNWMFFVVKLVSCFRVSMLMVMFLYLVLVVVLVLFGVMKIFVMCGFWVIF